MVINFVYIQHRTKTTMENTESIKATIDHIWEIQKDHYKLLQEIKKGIDSEKSF